MVPLKHADNYDTVVSTTAVYVRSQYLTFGLETNPISWLLAVPLDRFEDRELKYGMAISFLILNPSLN